MLDTAPLIYFLTGDARRAPVVRNLLLRAARSEVELVISAITESELLVAPLRQPDPETACAPVRDLLSGPPTIQIAEVTRAIGRRAAKIRATSKLTLANALVAATGLELGCTTLLSNDKRFRQVKLENLTYVHLDDHLTITNV